MAHPLNEYQAAIKTQVLKEYLMAWDSEKVGYNS